MGFQCLFLFISNIYCIFLHLSDQRWWKNYRSNIEQFIKWCDDNYLQLNHSKTKELIVDFRVATQQHESVKIKDENIEIVPKYKYLGTTIDNKLIWHDECTSSVARAQTRMFYLRKLSSLHVDTSLFYKSIVASIFLFNCVVWFGACKARILQTAKQIIANKNHNLNYLYELLRSGKRMRSVKCRTSQYLGSYVPYSVHLYNQMEWEAWGPKYRFGVVFLPSFTLMFYPFHHFQCVIIRVLLCCLSFILMVLLWL